MFRTTSEPSARSKSRQVRLDDLNLRKYASTVRRIFYPVWAEHGDWRYVLESGQDFSWACDFDQQKIIFARRQFPEKDLLRTALILQIAHARAGIDSPEAWIHEIERVQSVAESIGRDRIVRYLGEVMHQANSDILEIRRVDGNRLETTVTPVDAEVVSGTASDVSTFQDSLQIGTMERQLSQASDALRRLGLKN